ncbi:MAG: ferredoxin, partial [Eubacteriales bacterium]|nr:ferredoxin [Eubacteriales bacterium]
MVKRKNRVLCLLLGAALLASVLVGCGSSGTGSSERSDVSQPQSETQENESETSQTAQKAVPGESIVTNGGEVISLSSLEHRDEASDAVVYYTSDISAQAMLDIYAALGVELTGDNIAVKLSTGEPPASNYLDPNLIADLVHQVDGTIVENNTAYGGQRSSTAMHYQVAEDHG